MKYPLFDGIVLAFIAMLFVTKDKSDTVFYYACLGLFIYFCLLVIARSFKNIPKE